MAIDIRTSTCHADLETLSRRYAAALDRRDRAALLSVFDTDASMRVEQLGREPGLLRGHDELSRLTDIIARWPHTMHLVAQGLYHVDVDEARGEVYCTAHHFDSTDESGGRDHVMYIRYLDDYRLNADGRWQITSRTVRVEATEDRPVQIDSGAL